MVEMLEEAGVRATVIERNLIWKDDDVLVDILVARDAIEGSYPKDGERVPYLQFKRGFRGGYINCFIHGGAVSGKSIVARPVIMEKVLDDGRRYFHVDLFPVEGLKSTRRLLTVKRDHVLDHPEDCEVFLTPPPLFGMIAIVPLKEKKEGPELWKPKPVSTGDLKLDQLLNDGWAIQTAEAKTVLLSKVTNGKTKTMVHYRPKKK